MKTVLMVQHTESVHHTNGHAGAWGDWDLTERGREQAAIIGRWLAENGCDNTWTMFVSTLKRAWQTAEGINLSLGITPIPRDDIREVNAGAGNGMPYDWYRANQAPRPAVFDPDYRPFPDAESDRDLWERLHPFYLELLTCPAENILVISHGCALSFLQDMFMGRKVEDRGRFRMSGRSGSVSKFSINDDGSVWSEYVNRRVY